MSRRFRNRSRGASAISVGWLFADLLLALAMLFLIANTVTSAAKPKVIPTPTPTKVVLRVTPKPTPLPRLELNFHEIAINVDPTGLLNNSQDAVNSVKSQIRSQSILKGRSVGLVIAYGGAPGDGDISNAQAIAGKVYDILKSLGHEKFAFTRASYYSELYDLGGTPTVVKLDIYLFAQ